MEFALVLPFVCIFFVGLMYLALFTVDIITAENTARQCAREAAMVHLSSTAEANLSGSTSTEKAKSRFHALVPLWNDYGARMTASETQKKKYTLLTLTQIEPHYNEPTDANGVPSMTVYVKLSGAEALPEIIQKSFSALDKKHLNITVSATMPIEQEVTSK